MGPLLGLSGKTLTQIANFKTAKLKKGVSYHKASPQGKRPYRPLQTAPQMPVSLKVQVKIHLLLLPITQDH